MATEEKKESPDPKKDVLKDVLEDQNFNSDRLSQQVRLIALGLLAVVWALLITTQVQVPLSRRGLIMVACLAILAMLFDLVQYAIGYESSRRTYEAIEHGTARGYPRKSALYQARQAFFWAKQIVVMLAGILFLVVTVPKLI
jgi:hypothetical protein